MNISTKERDLEIETLYHKKTHDAAVNKYCIFKDQSPLNLLLWKYQLRYIQATQKLRIYLA